MATYNHVLNIHYPRSNKKNVPKTTESKSTVQGERLFLDISSSKEKSYGGLKFRILLVDDVTDLCWSIFVKAKSDMPQQVIRLIKHLRTNQQYPIKFIVKKIRCDNAGENQTLEQMCIDEM